MNGILGKNLIILGLVIAAVGAAVYFRDSIPLLRYFGRLPGDIVIKKDNFSFYFPLATGILISVLLSLLLFIFNKLRQ